MTRATIVTSRRALARAFAVVLTALAIGATFPAAAGMTVFTADGAAIRGYDPVAYFTEGKPVPGQAEFSHAWMGVSWRFANAENRDAFAAAPETYAPQYGGFCAWAVSQGYTADIDPAAWHIEDGRLYLNYSRSVQARWAADIPGNIGKADRNWPELKAGLAAR